MKQYYLCILNCDYGESEQNPGLKEIFEHHESIASEYIHIMSHHEPLSSPTKHGFYCKVDDCNMACKFQRNGAVCVISNAEGLNIDWRDLMESLHLFLLHHESGNQKL